MHHRTRWGGGKISILRIWDNKKLIPLFQDSQKCLLSSLLFNQYLGGGNIILLLMIYKNVAYFHSFLHYFCLIFLYLLFSPFFPFRKEIKILPLTSSSSLICLRSRNSFYSEKEETEDCSIL